MGCVILTQVLRTAGGDELDAISTALLVGATVLAAFNLKKIVQVKRSGRARG